MKVKCTHTDVAALMKVVPLLDVTQRWQVLVHFTMRVWSRRHKVLHGVLAGI